MITAFRGFLTATISICVFMLCIVNVQAQQDSLQNINPTPTTNVTVAYKAVYSPPTRALNPLDALALQTYCTFSKLFSTEDMREKCFVSTGGSAAPVDLSSINAALSRDRTDITDLQNRPTSTQTTTSIGQTIVKYIGGGGARGPQGPAGITRIIHEYINATNTHPSPFNIVDNYQYVPVGGGPGPAGPQGPAGPAGPAGSGSNTILAGNGIAVSTTSTSSLITVQAINDLVFDGSGNLQTGGSLIRNTQTALGAFNRTWVGDGNFGIGTGTATMTPSEKLDVQGNVNIRLDDILSWGSTGSSNLINGVTRNSGTSGLLYSSANSLLLGDLTGNVRGNYAIDLQTLKSVNTQIASGLRALTIGSFNTATGDDSIAIGVSNKTTNDYSITLGRFNEAASSTSIAIGNSNKAYGNNAILFGASNTVSSLSGVAVGQGNTVNGANANTFGFQNTASGNDVIASGLYNTVLSGYSAAYGTHNNITVNATSSFIFGSNITNSIASSTMIGTTDKGKFFIGGDGFVGIASSTSVLGARTSRIADEQLRVGGKVRAWAFDTDTSADIAEMFPSDDTSLEPGMLVMFGDIEHQWNTGGFSSSTAGEYLMNGVVRATEAKKTVGVISTNPGVTLGSNTKNGVPVAFSGRIPVRVTAENGQIRKGDRITLSPTESGVGTRLNGTGASVGIALSDDGGKGVVLMLVKNEFVYDSVTENRSTGSGLCIDDVCLNKDILRRIINFFNALTPSGSNANTSGNVAGQDTSTTSSTGTTTDPVTNASTTQSTPDTAADTTVNGN
jgi:hypothetical protein